MLDLLAILQQTPAPLPSVEWPWWYTLLVGAAGWGAAQVWPVYRDRIKRDQSAAERSAKAMEQIAEVCEDIKKYMAVADFRLASIERHLDLEAPRAKLTPRHTRRPASEEERGE